MNRRDRFIFEIILPWNKQRNYEWKQLIKLERVNILMMKRKIKNLLSNY